MFPNFLKTDYVNVFTDDCFCDQINFAFMLLKNMPNIAVMFLICV
mgnify:CR=1 FL=1